MILVQCVAYEPETNKLQLRLWSNDLCGSRLTAGNILPMMHHISMKEKITREGEVEVVI